MEAKCVHTPELKTNFLHQFSNVWINFRYHFINFRQVSK
jgi:hypothetical protein